MWTKVQSKIKLKQLFKSNGLGGYILVTKVDGSFKLDDGDIIVEVAWVVFRMNEDGDNIFFDMRIKFRLAIDVPLAQTNSQFSGSISV